VRDVTTHIKDRPNSRSLSALFNSSQRKPASRDKKATVKLKVKLSLRLAKHQNMATYWRSESIAPRILDLGTR